MTEEKFKWYSEKEKQLLVKIDKLHADWQDAWDTYREHHKNDYGVDEDHGDIIKDGFYPNYLSKRKDKIKILIIGRECYSMVEYPDYIESFIKRYQAGEHPNGVSLNQQRFHRLLIKIPYGILNKSKWDKIGKATDICKNKFFSECSFAFMNLSKLSNEGDDLYTDWQLVDTSLKMSLRQGRNFIFEEIELLDPDLIIGMHWATHRFDDNCDIDRPTLRAIFGNKIHIEKKDYYRYSLDLGKKKVLFLDTYHFSYFGIEEKVFYKQIVDAWKAFQEVSHIK